MNEEQAGEVLSLLATNQTDKIRVKGCIKGDITQCT